MCRQTDLSDRSPGNIYPPICALLLAASYPVLFYSDALPSLPPPPSGSAPLRHQNQVMSLGVVARSPGLCNTHEGIRGFGSRWVFSIELECVFVVGISFHTTSFPCSGEIPLQPHDTIAYTP